MLQDLKSCLQHGAQEVVDMRQGRVEFEYGDVALQVEVDLADAGHGLERRAQGREIFHGEIADGEDRGFCAHRIFLVETLPNPI